MNDMITNQSVPEQQYSTAFNRTDGLCAFAASGFPRLTPIIHTSPKSSQRWLQERHVTMRPRPSDPLAPQVSHFPMSRLRYECAKLISGLQVDGKCAFPTPCNLCLTSS